MKNERPNLRLKVAGFPAVELQKETTKEDIGLEILGWVDNHQAFYESLDLLLHPATHEAFGMVITEAMATGVPVLCSTECGAAELVTPGFGQHLPAEANVSTWQSEAEKLLTAPVTQTIFSRTWAEVASEYLALYQTLDI